MKQLTSISSLNGKRVYIAPANPAGRLLAKKLSEQGSEVLGLVDNLKTGSDIFNHPCELSDYDKIVVAEGEYQQTIASTLCAREFNHRKLVLAQSGHIMSFRYGLRARAKRNFLNLKLKFLSAIALVVPRIFPSSKVVYYTESFIDSNILIAWQTHAQAFSKQAILVTRHVTNIPDSPAKQLSADTLKGKITLLRAKCIVIDHEFQGLLFDTLRKHRPFVQLYHGLPYKYLAGNQHFTHINDHVFVSSSDYFNETIFPQLFRAKQFINLGYPRNDALLQASENRCWVNTPTNLTVQQLKHDTGPFWVYMPTYRDSGVFEMPFSLQQMQAFCEQHNRSLILKFHPFVAKQVIEQFELKNADQQLTVLPHFPNIYLYPTRMNIYPWLADAEALITDYSSVAFDFLLTDKPIVFFQYDQEQYTQARGDFTVPAEDFATGDVVDNEDALRDILAQIAGSGADTHKGARDKLRVKLGVKDKLACPPLIQLTRDIS